MVLKCADVIKKRGKYMEYRCVDRGRDRCPCALSEVGQCYVCNMIRNGKCDCGDSWEGSCPYTEFVQSYGFRNEEFVSYDTFKPPIYSFEAEVKPYEKNLYVIEAKLIRGFSTRFCEYGSFVMVHIESGYAFPLSVLLAEKGKTHDTLHIAVSLAGPKSIKFIDECSRSGKISFSGPFYSGLINEKRLDEHKKTLVILRGIAIAPFINIMQIELRKNKSLSNGAYFKKDEQYGRNSEIFLDMHKLPEKFVDKYLANVDYKQISLDNKDELRRLSVYAANFEQIIFLASPYHTGEFLRLVPERKSDIIISNSVNMCCGVGMCGACSHTDENGVTVRKCKCTDI